MSETLENLSRTLFKSWFVDFDPVQAKGKGRDPGLPAPLADVFPGGFADGEPAPMPAGWRHGSLLDVASLLSGGTPKTDRPEYWGGDILWASAKDISQCRDSFLVDTERTISREGLNESATQLIPRYATAIVARGATTGRMVLFGTQMAMNQTCYALVSKSDSPFFLYCLCRYVVDDLVHRAHGSVFDTITTSTFRASEIFVPPEQISAAFESLVTPFFRRMLCAIEQSRTLVGLGDALLPKLISGEIRVKDAERVVEAALG